MNVDYAQLVEEAVEKLRTIKDHMQTLQDEHFRLVQFCKASIQLLEPEERRKELAALVESVQFSARSPSLNETVKNVIRRNAGVWLTTVEVRNFVEKEFDFS